MSLRMRNAKDNLAKRQQIMMMIHIAVRNAMPAKAVATGNTICAWLDVLLLWIKMNAYKYVMDCMNHANLVALEKINF